MTTTTLEPDSRYTTAALIRRLLFEHALTHWRLYAVAFRCGLWCGSPGPLAWGFVVERVARIELAL